MVVWKKKRTNEQTRFTTSLYPFFFSQSLAFWFVCSIHRLFSLLKHSLCSSPDWSIRVRTWGCTFDERKHSKGTEVKAITYSAMQVLQSGRLDRDGNAVDRAEVYVIVDIWERERDRRSYKLRGRGGKGKKREEKKEVRDDVSLSSRFSFFLFIMYIYIYICITLPPSSLNILQQSVNESTSVLSPWEKDEENSHNTIDHYRLAFHVYTSFQTPLQNNNNKKEKTSKQFHF